MRSRKFALIALIFLAFSCKTKKVIAPLEDYPKGQVFFEKSDLLSTVLDKAAEEDKLVFIDFYADWCLPCKMMDEDVFSDQTTADYLNDNFVNYKIDAEKGNGPDLAQLYNIQAYPTLLFLDTKGRVLVSKMGVAYHTELRKLGDQALELKN